MYGDSYPRVNDIERNYRTTLSKTNLRSDRGDLRLYTFAGSNLHGGATALDKVQAPKIKGSTTRNLYAPVGETPYGRGFYDHLRATTPEPRKRSARSAPLMDEPEYTYTRPSRISTDTEYKTLPSRIYDIDSDLQKTTKKTVTTTESWVPLTTYIYNTPFHTYYYKATPYSSYTYRTMDDMYNYNYLDDYKRSTTTTTKTTSKNVDALDLSMSSKVDYSSYTEKCSKIQSQLEEVNRWMSEAESKIKNEVVTSRSRMQKDLAEVVAIVNDTAKYNDELHSAIRKQAKQISTLSSQYEDINRNIADVLETLDRTKARCQTLQSDLSSMQSSSSYEMVTKRVVY
jgi:hypothetical protein